MSERRKLPDRRELDAIEFDVQNAPYLAHVGYFPNGEISEAFLRAGKAGSALEALAHDLGVLFSITRQYGVPVTAIRKALLKLPSGRGAGPLGKLLDLVDQEGCLGP
jgi:hypothetical protein